MSSPLLIAAESKLCVLLFESDDTTIYYILDRQVYHYILGTSH